MIEFFAGIGLVHEALKPFGWEVVLANDNDPKKIAAYRANYPTTLMDSRCISDLAISDLPSATMATASFPCIDLSQAGYREGIHGADSGFVWDFLGKIRLLKEEGRAPQFVLLENVPNLLSISGGQSIDILLREIAGLGYAIDLVQVDAQAFTPQSRNRVFIIGVKREILERPNVMFPADHPIRRYKVREAYERNPNLPWHFFSFPKLPHRTISLPNIVEELPDNHPAWWTPEQLRYFWDIVETDHRVKLQAMLEAKVHGTFTAVRRLRRRRKREQIFNIRFDGLASCLRTPKGGSSTQYVVVLRHDGLRGRRLLPIEAARLQGVCLKGHSEDFKLIGTDGDKRFAFGDAVCVPAVRWVAEHSIEAILGSRLSDYEPRSLMDLLETRRA